MKTGHVGLNVPDVTRALPFYTGVFGWDVLREGADPDKRFAFLGDARRHRRDAVGAERR